MISSLLENKSVLIESTNDLIIYDKNNFIEYLNKYTNKKVDSINKDLIFEYNNPESLNNHLLNFNNFDVDNIINGLLKIYRTGGNHSMIVNKKYELFLQFNNNKIPGYERDIYYFNLNDLFNLKQ